jgi:serine/threonine-protein kinase
MAVPAPEPDVEALFAAAVDLPVERAASLLDERCAGAPAVRAAVERLLRHDRALPTRFLRPNTALMAVVVEAAGLAIGEPPAEEECALENQRVGGHFLIDERIGAGAAGIVYLARDEALDRRVALKIGRAGQPLSADLVREARLLARLTHPNVVQVHEIGQHGQRPFIAMEWVSGTSLRAWLAARPRTVGEVLELFLQAGRGLAAAHDAGLVHGDFKPENVLVGNDGRVRVADFGAAAVLTAAAADATPLGTPAFMAPEQFLHQAATPATDQFAFCVALYAALLHVVPFAGHDLAALRRNVVAGALRTRPQARGVPVALVAIVERGLACDPGARFPGMDALLPALERHLPRAERRLPSMGSRERNLVCGAMALLGIAVLAALHVVRASARTMEMRRLILIPAGALALHAVAAIALRRRLLASPFATKVAATAWLGGVTVVFHRLMAFRFGQPVAEVLAVDLLVLGLQQTLATLLLAPAFAFGALVFFAAAAVALVAPAQATNAMLGSVSVAYALGAIGTASERVPVRARR